MGARDVIFTILAIDEASRTLEKVGLGAEVSGGKLGKFGAIAGTALAGIALAAGAAAVKGVEMASSFQQAMERIHTQAGVGQTAVDQLSGKVLDLAGKVGTSPDSLAAALYHIESSFASAGITGEKAMQMLQTAAEGAKVGGADLVDTTNALNAAVVSGIPGVTDFNSTMGQLNALVGAGDMSMQDMAEAFGGGAITAVKTYGLNLRDVSAALALFGDNQVRGAEAGTMLRMSVQSLAVPAKTGKKALEELGLQSDTLAKAMQHGGLEEAVSTLVDHLRKAGISSKESGQILTEAFGKKAGTGINTLVDQFSRLQGKYVEVDKGSKSFGDSWAAQQKTFAQEWDEVKASIDAVLIKLGLKLIPVLQDVFGWVGQVGTALQGGGGMSTAMTAVSTVVAGVVGWFRDNLMPALQRAADILFPAVHKAVATVSAVFRDHQGIVQFVVAIFKILGALITDILIPELTAIAQLVLAVVGPAFRVIATILEDVVIPVIKFLLKVFMDMVGAIIQGAADAFGWVPGLGPKLKAAADKFDSFKNDVNNALDGIQSNKVIDISVLVNGKKGAIASVGGGQYNINVGGHSVRAMATGGIITHPTHALIGEGGEPEAVVPLSRASSLGFGRGGGDTYNIIMPPSMVMGSAADLARFLEKAIQEAGRSGVKVNLQTA